MATGLRSRQRLLRLFGPHGFELASTTRHLGIEASQSLRRRTWLRRSRLKQARMRLSRLSRLRRTGPTSVRHVARSGAVAQALWGSETYGICGATLRGLQASCARAVAKFPISASPQLYLRTDPKFMRFDPAIVHHSALFRHWHVALNSGLVARDLMWSALTRACARLCHSRRPWAKVSGPASALVMSAARLGWSIQDEAHWCTEGAVPLNLSVVSASYVGRLGASSSGR
eukprot:2107648-Amphidinium_carterae.1